jgi:hypothetical protein
MATTDTATERDAIAAVVGLYIDGASQGDPDKLKAAFHERAWMFGSRDGRRVDVPIEEMFAMSIVRPLDSDGSYRARITAIEQVGGAATATVEEDGCWGGVSFTDFLSLVKIDGSWKIVSKTFAHTGGEPVE